MTSWMGTGLAALSLVFAPAAAWASCVGDCYSDCYDTFGDQLGTPRGNLECGQCLDYCNEWCLPMSGL
jgi:hypothetical protein